MCVVCSRAKARARLQQLVPRGRAGGVVAGKGRRSCRSVGLVRPTSLSRSGVAGDMQDPSCLDFCRTDGLGSTPSCSSLLCFGPRAGSSNGQCWWLTRMTSVWFQRRMWGGGERVTRCDHQHKAVREYQLYPHCVPGSLLEVNRIDPTVASRELLFHIRLPRRIEKGRRPLLLCVHTCSVKPRADQDDGGGWWIRLCQGT